MSITTNPDDPLQRLLGKSADGCTGHELYTPQQRSPTWIVFVPAPRREPRWRRLLRWFQRLIV